MLRAHQLCSLSSHRPAQERASKRIREQRKQELRRRAALRCRMQLCVEFCFPPHFHQRKMTIFAPPFTKKSPAARLKMRLPCPYLGGGRCAATRFETIIHVSHEGVSLPRACASASTSGQLHQEKDCSTCAQRAHTASAAAANSGTQVGEVRREVSSGPALGAKCRGCRPRLQERVLKILLSPLKKGS